MGQACIAWRFHGSGGPAPSTTRAPCRAPPLTGPALVQLMGERGPYHAGTATLRAVRPHEPRRAHRGGRSPARGRRPSRCLTAHMIGTCEKLGRLLRAAWAPATDRKQGAALGTVALPPRPGRSAGLPRARPQSDLRSAHAPTPGVQDPAPLDSDRPCAQAYFAAELLDTGAHETRGRVLLAEHLDTLGAARFDGRDAAGSEPLPLS
jgi:hypothetical protein